jgi:hypothetical protein
MESSITNIVPMYLHLDDPISSLFAMITSPLDIPVVTALKN